MSSASCQINFACVDYFGLGSYGLAKVISHVVIPICTHHVSSCAVRVIYFFFTLFQLHSQIYLFHIFSFLFFLFMYYFSFHNRSIRFLISKNQYSLFQLLFIIFQRKKQICHFLFVSLYSFKIINAMDHKEREQEKKKE